MTAGMSDRKAEVAQLYDAEADAYAAYHEPSFAWRHIEKPALDRYLSCPPGARVLDVGCGSGLGLRYLLSRGVRAEDMTGFDISAAEVAAARHAVPGATVHVASADEFKLPPASFARAMSVMMLHYLNSEQLQRCLERVYDVLEENGEFVFVDADPDYSEETRDPSNVNTWLELPTPWHTTSPWFSRHPYELLIDYAYFAGFDVVGGGPLPVAPEGATADPAAYQKYTSYPARMGGVLRKVSEAEKQFRIAHAGESNPSLT